ncbi:MAG: TIGR01777 family protein [Ignavibacteriae bacterium HGW-Ignavibacteriae-3]|nr:MAG: TIGR01777 family protein [Ignavibacteriae bacterium HGW-Ignavibacteriae-3]
MKKIVMTGATGLIGRKIADKLISRGDEVTILTRDKDKAESLLPGAAEYVNWNYNSNDWQEKLSGKDAVIHLAGENVMAKRWSEEHKKNILNSRVDSTRALVSAIGSSESGPELFISASAIGYYGNSEQPVDEDSSAGTDFLAEVVRKWEDESKKIDPLNVRRVNVRIGIVLDKDEGALAKFITPFKLFVGGPLGKGEQWFSWVHVDDVIGLFLFALDNEKVRGVINAASPNPVRMKAFCKTLGKVMKKPSSFKVPADVLRIVYGEAADVLLTGAPVIPKRTLDLGYKFRFEKEEDALRALLSH